MTVRCEAIMAQTENHADRKPCQGRFIVSLLRIENRARDGLFSAHFG
jgi:hypothetical protein